MLPTDNTSRKALPLWSYLINYFPDVFVEQVRVSVEGNKQHNPGQDLHWAREKSKDQMNTAFRHMIDHGRGATKDIDGCYHLAKAIWRLSAELQLTIEREKAQDAEILAAQRACAQYDPADLPVAFDSASASIK